MTSDTRKTAARDPRRHHDLIAWQRAVDLVKAVYPLSDSVWFRRCVGQRYLFRRTSRKARHATAARSLCKGCTLQEVLLQRSRHSLVLCRELGFVKDVSALDQLIAELFGILSGLDRSLQARGK